MITAVIQRISSIVGFTMSLKICIYWKPQNVILFGIMSFINIIIVRNKIKKLSLISLRSKPNECILLYEKQKIHKETDTEKKVV